MAEEKVERKIHDPGAEMKKWDDDRRAISQTRTQIQSKRNLEDMTFKVKKLEFRVDELERHVSGLLDVVTELAAKKSRKAG